MLFLALRIRRRSLPDYGARLLPGGLCGDSIHCPGPVHVSPQPFPRLLGVSRGLTAPDGFKPEAWTFTKEESLVGAAILGTPEAHINPPLHRQYPPHTHYFSPSPGRPAQNTLQLSVFYMWLVQVPPTFVRPSLKIFEPTETCDKYKTFSKTRDQNEGNKRHRKMGLDLGAFVSCAICHFLFT